MSKPELLGQMRERFDKAWEINERKIRLKCSEVHQRLEVHTLRQDFPTCGPQSQMLPYIGHGGPQVDFLTCGPKVKCFHKEKITFMHDFS